MSFVLGEIRGNNSKCPNLPLLNGEFIEPVVSSCSDTTGYGCVACSYGNPVQFQEATQSAITLWNNNFININGNNPEEALNTLNTEILPYYCRGTTTDCPIDPFTGVQLEECSLFLDTKSYICSEWSAVYPILADESKNYYCSQNPDAIECGCLLRDDNEIYKIATSSGDIEPGTDHCWFIPCSNPSFYLMTQELLNQIYEPCPDICGIVVRNFNNEDIEVIGQDAFNENISCNYNSGSKSIAINATNNKSLMQNNQNTTNLWYLYVIITFIIVGIILGVILGIYYS